MGIHGLVFGQLFMGVVRRRRRHRPFQRRRTGAPIIAFHTPPLGQCVDHDEDEQQTCQCR